jgi:peroxiredoxin Q/BCP
MKCRALLNALVAGTVSLLCGPAGAANPGDTAPAFDLVDQYMKPHRLSDYSGRWVVLYFYPKDDTPGCTTEACNFRDDIFKIRELGAEVIGVSLDSAESHAKFAEKHGLPFPLLADTEGKVAEQYECITTFAGFRVARRHTFIIGPDGRFAKIYTDVDPKTHSQEVITDLKNLQAAR